MIKIVNLEGVKAIVRKANFTITGVAVLAMSTFILSGCGGSNAGATPGSNEAAATVNGKVITLEKVERLLKQQAQGQEAKMSPLELAQARLQIVNGLIQDEVLFQKAEKEGTVPTDDEVKAEFNKMKTASGKTEEQWKKDLETANETEASLLDTVKKQLGVKKLEEKITGQVTPPKDSEVQDFYNGNKSAFVKKKGAKLAAIVIDPADSGEGDVTKNDADAVRVGNEVIGQLKQDPESFTQIAREKSEDQSRMQGGDLGWVAEDDLKQSFSPQVAATIMTGMQKGGLTVAQAQGKFFILKLQDRSDKDEALTLESPGVREQVTNSLTEARKQLLVQAFTLLAMQEAKIVNKLAEKVVANPNDLSGARPAGSDAPAANANTPAANAPAANAPAANSNAAKPAANTEKPAANAAKTNTNK